ncbi:hypothetical protein WA026_015494 [Henosepilachna vigintioctopunctata]|uniref:Uncharacterized protein n=1 Tax=Henosepilachna vigintioctopunctata TaxID=420089 RepID=A0AAW1UCM0_9CUCU
MVRRLTDGNIAADFSEEISEKRWKLKTKLIEECAEENTAYIEYDKLVLKEGNQIKEKRKRDLLTSPHKRNEFKKQRLTTVP